MKCREGKGGLVWGKMQLEMQLTEEVEVCLLFFLSLTNDDGTS